MDQRSFDLYVSMLYLKQSLDKVKALLDEEERMGGPSPVEVTAFPDGGKKPYVDTVSALQRGDYFGNTARRLKRRQDSHSDTEKTV